MRLTSAGFEAVNLAYSSRNRSVAVRIPMYWQSPKAKRLEFRPPDPSRNAHLAFSAMLMAGLDGIQNQIDPGPPLDKDIYDMSPEELKNVPSMPGSLEESLQALESDYDFLLANEVFTEDLIERWIEYERRHEISPVRMRPHPIEFSMYLTLEYLQSLRELSGKGGAIHSLRPCHYAFENIQAAEGFRERASFDAVTSTTANTTHAASSH